MDYKYLTGYTVSFFDYATGVIAKAICCDNVPLRTFIFIPDKCHFFEDNVQEWLVKDIQQIVKWCAGLGYDAKMSYNQKPMISELTSSDSEIPTFMLFPPSINIEITKKQK